MNEPDIRRTLWAALGIAGILFAAILGYFLVSSWGMPWPSAVALALPLSGLAQGIAWSARYSCRSNPLARTNPWRVAVTHIAAAMLLSAVWVGTGRFLAAWLDSGLGLAGTYARFHMIQTRLYGVGFSYYLLGVAFQYMLFAQQASREAQARALESGVRAREAELNALKAQINPHFLYNSLNSISALTSIDPSRARDMCVLLADFLRMTLGVGDQPAIPVKQELDLLEKYCAIEKVRFGDRLQIHENVQEDAKSCLIPPLLLQPLVENAVIHGIAQMAAGGEVRLLAARNGDRLVLTVENSWDPEAGGTRRNGVGLKNVQRRLEARYGKEAHLEAKADDEVFRVSLSFPAELEKTP